VLPTQDDIARVNALNEELNEQKEKLQIELDRAMNERADFELKATRMQQQKKKVNLSSVCLSVFFCNSFKNFILHLALFRTNFTNIWTCLLFKLKKKFIYCCLMFFDLRFLVF